MKRIEGDPDRKNDMGLRNERNVNPVQQLIQIQNQKVGIFKKSQNTNISSNPDYKPAFHFWSILVFFHKDSKNIIQKNGN